MDELKPCPFCEFESEIETPDRKFCLSLFTAKGSDYVGIAYDKKTGKFYLHAESGIYDYMEDCEITTCPVCGKALNRRPAPENKPLTLARLRQMDGEPVWVVFDDDSAMWALLDVKYKDLKLTGNWGEQIVLGEHRAHIKAIYARKPEQEEK
ncbi:hypothetical protein [Clostridium minihomine]|uniref:hypothetical protein n=1 Tax=Clostridium minihomine TaxID=2045012 RepID=UPI000C7686F9|nr:hypothetical protein [Clostridium minihomine]